MKYEDESLRIMTKPHAESHERFHQKQKKTDMMRFLEFGKKT